MEGPWHAVPRQKMSIHSLGPYSQSIHYEAINSLLLLLSLTDAHVTITYAHSCKPSCSPIAFVPSLARHSGQERQTPKLFAANNFGVCHAPHALLGKSLLRGI